MTIEKDPKQLDLLDYLKGLEDNDETPESSGDGNSESGSTDTDPNGSNGHGSD